MPLRPKLPAQVGTLAAPTRVPVGGFVIRERDGMVRPEKVAVVEEIAEKLESSRAVFLTEYRGLSVAQQQELRRAMRAADAEYKVLKMTLARRAAETAGFSGLVQWLEGPTAIAFTTADPVPTAKGLKEFSEANEALVIKGGMLLGDILEADDIRKLADIEPREVLLAKLAGAMKAPLSNLAGLMSAVLRQPATVFQQLLEKKEQEPAAAEASAHEATAAEEEAPDAPPVEAAKAEGEGRTESEDSVEAPAAESEGAATANGDEAGEAPLEAQEDTAEPEDGGESDENNEKEK